MGILVSGHELVQSLPGEGGCVESDSYIMGDRRTPNLGRKAAFGMSIVRAESSASFERECRLVSGG